MNNLGDRVVFRITKQYYSNLNYDNVGETLFTSGLLYKIAVGHFYKHLKHYSLHKSHTTNIDGWP